MFVFLRITIYGSKPNGGNHNEKHIGQKIRFPDKQLVKDIIKKKRLLIVAKKQLEE